MQIWATAIINKSVHAYYLHITVRNTDLLLNKNAKMSIKLYTSKDLKAIKRCLNSLLKVNNFGQLDDFNVGRIDYAIDMDYIIANRRNCALDILKRAPAVRKSNKRVNYENGIKESNKTLNYNIYFKLEQMQYKYGTLSPKFKNQIKGILRYEVQINKTNMLILSKVVENRKLETLFSEEVINKVLYKRLRNLLKDYNYYTQDVIFERHRQWNAAFFPEREAKELVETLERPNKLSKKTRDILNDIEVNQVLINHKKFRFDKLENVLNYIPYLEEELT